VTYLTQASAYSPSTPAEAARGLRPGPRRPGHWSWSSSSSLGVFFLLEPRP